VAQHEIDIPQGAEGVTARLRFTRGSNGRSSVKGRVHPDFRHSVRRRPAGAALPDICRSAIGQGAFRDRLQLAERRTTAVVTRYRPTGLIRG
jgi:hypothetical protein